MKVLLTIVLVSSVVWLLRFLKLPEEPVQVASSTRIEIYCADCDSARARHRAKAGLAEERTPYKTFLTIDRRCDGCGGRSYVLASIYAPLWATRIKSERAARVPVIHEYSDAPRRRELVHATPEEKRLEEPERECLR